MNNFYNDYSIPSRVKKGKSKQFKSILFISIGLVLGLTILGIYYVYENIWGKTQLESKGSTATLNENQQVAQEQTPPVNEEQTTSNIETTSPTPIETPSNSTSEPTTNSVEANEGVNRPWNPVGTIQTEPHTTDFTKDSQDWKEMVQATQYATGIQQEKLIIWRLENGGASNLVTGVVSSYENKQTPYKIQLEWVPNEGWMPTDMIQLNENPYLN